MHGINYKMKYEALKLKFMDSVDEAYRLGYEQGMKDGQVEAMMQPQPGDEMGAEGGMPGEEGQDPNAPPQEGSELDQHIAQLEGMVGGGGGEGEAPGGEAPDATGESHAKKDKGGMPPEAKEKLKKSLDSLKAYRDAITLHKNMQAIKKIGHALKPKPKFALAKNAQSNLPDHSKKAVSMQEDIVKDVMKSWAEEEKRVSKSIVDVLNVEGLTKKE